MEGLRHLGATMDPHVAFLLLRGMKTLHLRMAAHCANAREVAASIEGQPGVKAVYYPGSEQHAGHDVGQAPAAEALLAGDESDMTVVDLDRHIEFVLYVTKTYTAVEPHRTPFIGGRANTSW